MVITPLNHLLNHHNKTTNKLYYEINKRVQLLKPHINRNSEIYKWKKRGGEGGGRDKKKEKQLLIHLKMYTFFKI